MGDDTLRMLAVARHPAGTERDWRALVRQSIDMGLRAYTAAVCDGVSDATYIAYLTHVTDELEADVRRSVQ